MKTRSATMNQMKRQKGIATLFVGVVLLFVITLVTLYAARTGFLEQAISGNDYKAKRAFEAAQAGLDFAQVYFKRNIDQYQDWGWTDCVVGQPDTFPRVLDGDGNPAVDTDGNPIYALKGVFDGTNDQGALGYVGNNLCSVAAGANAWTWIAVPDANIESLDGDSGYRVYYFTRRDDAGNLLGIEDIQVTYVSEGVSDISTGTFSSTTWDSDEKGYSFMRVTTDVHQLVSSDVIAAPLTASGSIGAGGTFDVVPNPNGGGLGVPVSAWSKNNVTLSGTPRTCHLHEYFSTGSPYICSFDSDPYCSNTSSSYTYGQELAANQVALCEDCSCTGVDALTYVDGSGYHEGPDILDVDSDFGESADTSFPDDIFAYIFGYPSTEWQQIYNRATKLPDCSSLDQTSKGLFWIEGDCSGLGSVGSIDGPAVIIVEGDTKVNANSRIFGMIFAFDHPDIAGTGGTVTLNGTVWFYGAVISDHAIDLGTGTYHMVYNDKVFKTLVELPDLNDIGRIPGTWFDFTQLN